MSAAVAELADYAATIRAHRARFLAGMRALERAVPLAVPRDQVAAVLAFLRLQAAQLETYSDAEIRRHAVRLEALLDTLLGRLPVGGHA